MRAVRGQHDEQLVKPEQLGAGTPDGRPGDARVLLAEHDVEVVREQARERRPRLLVRDLDAEPRVTLGEPGEDLGHEGEQHRLERGDAQRAAHLGQRGAQLRLGLLKPLKDGLGVRDQDPRLRGEPHAAPGRLE